MKALLSIFAIINFVKGDLYMQGCRGSNNRLDEPSRDRANGNRLFDSQNNDRGGYNVGKLSYYVGEIVPISWTNQHSAGTYQLYGSELIIQYACDILMRDGTTTNRIPDRPTQCENFDCDTDVEYGRHESFTDYQYCKATTRNKGLFTANQDLNGDAAIYTRQNPQGTRRGYECPEERDYYPYWRPSMWQDIAIFTNQPDRCAAYQTESQNVKDRYYCKYNDVYWTDVLQGYVDTATGELPITEENCTNATFVSSSGETLSKWSWTRYPSFGTSEPDCITASQTRDNHHGLIGGRTYYTYQWTVPDVVDSSSETCCVVRMRYNISTNDYQGWESDSSVQAGVDHLNNSQVTNPDPDYDPAWLRIWESYNLTYEDIAAAFLHPDERDGYAQDDARGYVFVNNPHVDPFGWQFNYSNGTGTVHVRMQLQLAINTNQFGRTFQDRTHCFQIRARPSWIDSSATIKLLTVQGKRGNIVQVYPATEYFFIPEPLTVSIGDYVHFCWTGSNTNPDNNDGQGLEGTDRSNLCPLTQPQYDKSEYSDIDDNVIEYEEGAVGDLGNSYPDFVQTPEYGLPTYYDYANIRNVTPSLMAGFDINVIAALCTGRRADTYSQVDNYGDFGLFDFGNMKQMDDEGTTFCIDPQLVESNGQWNFISTRNNAFSNRDQKGTLKVQDSSTETYTVGSTGLSATSGGSGTAVITVNPGMVEDGNTLNFEVTTWSNTGGSSTIVEVTGSDGGAFSSTSLSSGGWIELWIPYTPEALHTPDVYYRASTVGSWSKHDTAVIEYNSKTDTYYAVTNIAAGGYYKAVNVLDGWLVLVVVLAFGCFGAVLAVAIYKKCSFNRKN